MIIECPACSTKFSVDSQLVREIEDPRFHCSRCGHYFQQKAQAQDSAPKPAESKTWQVDHERAESLRTSDPLHGEQLSLIPEQQKDQMLTIQEPPANQQPRDEQSAEHWSKDQLEDEQSIFGQAESLEEPGFSMFDEQSTFDEPITFGGEDLWPQETAASGLGAAHAPEFPERIEAVQAPSQFSPSPQAVTPAAHAVTAAAQAVADAERAAVAEQPAASLQLPHIAAAWPETPEPTPEPISASAKALPGMTGSAIPATAYEERPSQRANAAAEGISQEDSEWSNAKKAAGWSLGMAFSRGESSPKTKELLGNIELRKSQLRRAAEPRVAPVQVSHPADRHERRARKRSQRHEQRYLEAIRDTPADQWVGVDNTGWKVESRRLFSNAPVLFVSSVPLLCMLCFSLLAADFSDLPPALRGVFNLDKEKLPKLPPSGLEVVNLESEVVALHDGNKVLEVRGEILNATLRAYKSVRVETVLYDGQNTQLRTRVVDVSNGLQEAKLPALRTDAIDELQEQPDAGDLSVGPHQKAPFRVVFTDLSGNEQWLTSRVFSVKKS